MNIKRSFNNDYTFGMSQEEIVLDKLRIFFDDPTIENSKMKFNKFCKFDFYSEKSETKFELKSRRNEYKKYPTTIIPIHKRMDDENLYFIFNFTDGIYYIKYDKEIFETFNKKNIQIRRYGKYDPPTDHWEIPINLLKEMKKEPKEEAIKKEDLKEELEEEKKEDLILEVFEKLKLESEQKTDLELNQN